LETCDAFEKNEKFLHLSHIIDKRIYDNYKIYKTNYIAYDMLMKTEKYVKYYSKKQQSEFETYMNNGLENIEGEHEELKNIFLDIYANPLKNKEL